MLTGDYTKVDLLKQKKAIMCIKTDNTTVDPKDPKQDSSRLCDRVVFMEISKPILESMHNVCNVRPFLFPHYTSCCFLDAMSAALEGANEFKTTHFSAFL